jgi:hypothetical protein
MGIFFVVGGAAGRCSRRAARRAGPIQHDRECRSRLSGQALDRLFRLCRCPAVPQ